MTFIQRSIVLLATPILAQFIFVLVLLGAFRKVEELTFADIQFRNQSAELMRLSTMYYRSIGLVSVYVITKDQNFLNAFDTLYQNLSRKSELLELLANGKATNSTANKTRTGFKKVLKGLGELRQLIELNPKTFGNRFLRAAEVQQDIEEALTDLNLLMSERARSGLNENRQIEESRWVFLSAVLGGFAANMFLTGALLFIFAKDFALRFNIIVDNTRRLPQGLSLNPPIGGKDELCDLDRFFHNMTSELKATQERKDQLVSMVSHDLRNPLAALNLSLQSMSAGIFGEMNQELSKRVIASEKVVKRLSGLVNDILDLEKLRSGKMQLSLSLVEMNKLVADCVQELEPLLSASSIKIETNLDDVLVLADPERIAQVIINLLANAIKFSPQNSKISIESEDLSGFVKIKIQDRGPGVPENFRDLIFLPFEQVPDDKRPKKGSTGLGLPISKMLMDLHGGKIGVDVNTQGSCFWFTLAKPELEQL